MNYVNKVGLVKSYFVFNISSRPYSSKQVGNTMNKILGSTSKKKKFHYESVPSENIFSNSSPRGASANPKRASVLNKLFMRNITDLMSTGEYASQILGLGVEVNKVKITWDYKILKVYWTCRDSEGRAEQILQQNAGLLRHELSQLRLMGNVPMIQFVKDKSYTHFIELNKRLSIADYGEDPPSDTDYSARLISEFELSVAIEKDLKEKIAKLEKENPEISMKELPPMTNCVFELNREDILNRVRKTNRHINEDSNLANEDNNWANFKLKQCSNVDPLKLGNLKTQREAFNKFLHQRQLLREKQKEQKYRSLDSRFVYEEVDLKSSNCDEFTEGDFIIEDIEEKI